MGGLVKLKMFDTVRGTLEVKVRDVEEAELIAAVVHELEPSGRKRTHFELTREWWIEPSVSPIRKMPGTKIDGVTPG